jgi:hypothetical protein
MHEPIISIKATVAATLAITLSLATVSQLFCAHTSFGQSTYINPRLVLETFTARGLIGSLIFNNSGKVIAPSFDSTDENQHINTTNKNPYILAGNWGLNVVNRKITYFEVNFPMVHTDGTDRHTHEFNNFKRVSVIPILLDPKGITFIGMMDIRLNGADKWFGVPVSVAIGKNFNTISIITSPKYTDNHFMGQSIFGVFTSVKDRYGTELISGRPLA